MFWFHIFTHTMCLSASQEGQNKSLNSLELELLVAVNSHMDAWNWTWDLCRIKKHSSTMSHLHAWLWTSRELNFKVETCYLYYQVNLRFYGHGWKVMVVRRCICVSGSSMMLTFVNLTIVSPAKLVLHSVGLWVCLWGIVSINKVDVGRFRLVWVVPFFSQWHSELWDSGEITLSTNEWVSM